MRRFLRRRQGLPAGDVPKRAYLRIGDREVPLLPVYVGLQPGEDGSPMHSWMLYVHPDVEEEIVFTGPIPPFTVDVVPARSSVGLMVVQRPDGTLVAVKHVD